MRWVAPTEKYAANETLEKRLWDAACSIRSVKDAASRGLTPVYSN